MRHAHSHFHFRHSAPPLDVGAFTTHLWSAGLAILTGAVVGALAVLALEYWRLRWSWALLLAPLAYALWFVGWRLGLAVTVATGTAVWLGVRRHGEAIQHGGEEARKMRETLGPLRWAVSGLRGRLGRRRGDRIKGERLAIGTTRGGGPAYVPFGIVRGVHTLIAGATGSGKTVTIEDFVQAYVLADFGAIVLDGKGDDGLRRRAMEVARAAGVRFVEWSPRGPHVYNPFARGGPTEIADKALAAHQWSEPHYEMGARRQLGYVLSTLEAAQMWPPTLQFIVAHMDTERLDALASKVGGETAERVSAYVDSLSAKAKADLGGARDRLAVLADSEIGPWLDPSVGAREEIDLAECLGRGDVVYFDLDADRYPGAAKMVAASITVDLVSLSADMQGSGPGGLVVIDEFAALVPEQVSRLFARARAACLSIVLATQSLADLRCARPDDPSDTLTEQVLANVESVIAHRIGDPDSAERLARLAGTEPSWSVTQRVSGSGTMLAGGEGTRTREREFIVLPDQLKRLPVGEAAVITPTGKRPAQIVRIWPPRDLGAGR